MTMTKPEREKGREILHRTERALDRAEITLACKMAIKPLLEKIAGNPEYARLFPAECADFANLTAAAALLWDLPVAEVREKYFPMDSKSEISNLKS